MSKQQSELAAAKNTDWLDLGNLLACRSCFHYSNHDDVPKAMKPSARFGIIKKDQQQFHLNHSKKEHCEKPLHRWCQKKEKEDLKNKAENQENNVRAGEKVVRNALYCLKRGLGAEDFLGLNEKDLGSDIKNTATNKS